MKREYSSIGSSVTAFCVPLLFLLVGHATRVGAETDFLDVLRKKDLSFSRGAYTISFGMQEQANLDDPNQGMVFMDCWAAQNAIGTLAITITYHYEKDPVFVAPGSRGYGPIDYREGNLVVWRKTQKYVLSSPERNVAIEKLKVFLIDPNNRVVRTGENTLVHRLPVGSADSAPEFHQFQLSTGWGYSKHLKRIVSTQPADGLLKITADGSYGIGSERMWELSLDPNSDYMVRSASQRLKGMDKPSVIIRNSGVLLKDNLRIARHGTYEWVGGLKLSVDANDIIIGPSRANRLVDEVVGVVDSPLPVGTSILDLRGPEPVRTTVESPE